MSKAFQSCLPPGGTSDFHYRFLGRAPGRGCHIISNEFKWSEVIRSDLSISAISCTNYTSQKYRKDIDVSSVVCCFLRTQFHTLCTSVHHCAFLQPLRDACDAFQGYPGFWVMLLHCLREVSEATGIHGVTQDPETTGMSSRKLDESPQRGLIMRYNWYNEI